MAKTVKVAFEVDVEEVKKIIAAGKGRTAKLSAADVDKLGKKDVIKASDLLTKQIADGVITIFAKMQQFPDYSPTLVNKIAKQFVFPKEQARLLVRQQVMFHAGIASLETPERPAPRRRG